MGKATKAAASGSAKKTAAAAIAATKVKSAKVSSSTSGELSPQVERILKVRKLVLKRDEARANGDFGRADTIRDLLASKYNAELLDQKNGPSGFRFLDGSSTKIPPGTKLPAPTAEDLAAKAKAKALNTASSVAATKTSATKKVEPKAKAGEAARMKQMLESASNTAGRTVNGVLIEEIEPGFGVQCKTGDRVRVHYTGRLKANGRQFDSSVGKKPFVFRLGAREVITGWDIGVNGMAVGSKRKLTIPPEKAYGKSGAPPTIPGGATLVFDVQLLGIN